MVHSHRTPFIVASLQYRLLLYSYLAKPAIAIRSLSEHRTVWCDVIKNGLVREFLLPKFTPFVGLLLNLAEEEGQVGS
jgi:hypothetical protein